MKNKNKNFTRWYYELVRQDEDFRLGIKVENSSQENEELGLIEIESNEELIISEPKTLRIDKNQIELPDGQLNKEAIQFSVKNDQCHLEVKANLGQTISTQQSKWYKGLMGPYNWLPFMPFNHDVVALSQTVEGSVHLNGRTIDLTGGRGYIERSWGKQRPRVWIWGKCNTFKTHDMALMFGITRMRVLMDYETVFAVPVYYKGKLEVFAGYNGGQIAKLYRYKGYVHLIITQKDKMLDLKIYGSDEANINVSKNSHGIKDVYECYNSKIEVKILQNGRTVLEDVGTYCHLQMGGNTSKLK